jgi:hypothetical protein
MQKLKERISRHITLMELGQSEEDEDSKKTYCVYRKSNPQERMCGMTYWAAVSWVTVNPLYGMEPEE